MKKSTKILITSLTLIVIIVISMTGIAMAQDPFTGDCPNTGKCPNASECPNAGECLNTGECPKASECPNAGECLADGSGIKTQSQTCTSVCNQKQFNDQSGAKGNCYAKKNCRAYQNMCGINSD